MSQVPTKHATHRLLGPLRLFLLLVPTLSVLWQGLSPLAGLAAAGGRNAAEARRKVLVAIPSDAAVLINVTQAEMPASPDILNLGRRSTRALERCLADNAEASIRSTCAQVLEALGDRRALGTLQTALEDWEPDVRHRVVLALRAIPDPSSVEPLMRLYRRQDEAWYVRSAILDALGAMSDMRAVRLLRDELRRKPKDEDKNEDPRPAAFAALWASRHLMARATLVGDVRYCLQSESDSLVHAATEAAAELRDPGLVSALVPLLEHQWPDVRNKAVYALGRIGDRTATKALLAQVPKVRDGRMLNNIAFALERLDKDAFYGAIVRVIEHKQAVIRLNAAFVLGDVKHRQGLPLLQKALGDPSDFVRTSAVVALGKLGLPEAAAAIEPLVDSPNLSVRQEAIFALHALAKGGRADLIHDRLFSLPARKHAAAIKRAALALGQAGDVRARDYLLGCLERGDCGVEDVAPLLHKAPWPEGAARVLLGWSRGRHDLRELLAGLKPDGSGVIAMGALGEAWGRRDTGATREAIDLLGDLGLGPAAPLIQPHAAREAETWLRLHATVALARLGGDEAARSLLAELDTLPVEYLPRFAALVARVAEPDVRAKLGAELEKRQGAGEAPAALAVAAIRLHWDPEAAIFRFLQALASPSGQERDLAARYLAREKGEKVTWLLRRALARQGRDATGDRLRLLLDERG
ncbi:MAG: HEAT repeat domain-containing protein [Deltaproteobacteria bacterium]|nr:HEAT repeat domain-containing protein [Deltaproteobacteria bacterium]